MTESSQPYGNGAPAEPLPYENTSQQTLLRVLDLLALEPLAETALATLVAASPHFTRDQTFRAVKNLEIAGWVMQTPGGNWRLTPHLTRLSERLRLAIHDLHHTYLQPGASRHD